MGMLSGKGNGEMRVTGCGEDFEFELEKVLVIL